MSARIIEFGRAGAAKSWATRFAAVAVSLCICVAVVRWSSPTGLALTTDSLRYLYASVTWSDRRALLIPSYWLGDSAWIPLTHFPPLYPILLGAMNGPRGLQSAEDTALAIAITASALTLLLFCQAVWDVVNDGFIRTALLAAVISTLVVSGALLFVESEAIWLPLLVATLLSLAKFMESGRSRWLAAACVLVALGTLARYAAIATIPLLLYATWSSQKRRLGFLAAGISALPLAIWVVRNLLLARTAIDRPLTLSAPPLSTIAIGFALIAVSAWRHGKSERCLAMLSYAFVVCYGATVVVAISTVEPRTVFDGRLLSPAMIALLIAVPEGLHRVGASMRRGVLIGAAVGSVVAGVIAGRAHSRGLGFTSKAWRSSELMEGLREIPSSATVMSNAPDLIYLYLGRRSYWTPQAPPPGYVAAFDALAWRPYVAGPAALSNEPHLKLVRKYSDGALYFVAP